MNSAATRIQAADISSDIEDSNTGDINDASRGDINEGDGTI